MVCQEVGPLRPSGPARPPLVLLHGIGADRNEWVLSLPLLARRQRTLAFDLLLHGGSDRPAGAGIDFRVRLLADAVVGGLEVLGRENGEGVRRINLLGHSLGGAVALDIARRFPRLVERLVLVDSAGLPPAEALTPLSAALPFAPRGFSEARRLLKTSVHSPILANDLVAAGAALYKGRRRNRPQLMRLLASLAAGEDCLDERQLARISQPTLVLWGANDRVFPVATGRRLVAALPHARLEILPRCGHVPPVERPLAFARRVEAFLA